MKDSQTIICYIQRQSYIDVDETFEVDVLNINYSRNKLPQPAQQNLIYFIITIVASKYGRMYSIIVLTLLFTC